LKLTTSLLRALVLGIVQGVTEFLPISSSGHLVLVPWLLRWENPGLAFDAMLHLGTLCAVVAFFWRDLRDLVVAGLASIKERSLGEDPRRKLAWCLVLGTVPAAVIGFVFNDLAEALFAAPVCAGALLLVTGALLAICERRGRLVAGLEAIGWTDALVVGFAQALAIAPGISRSGATMSAGLWRGLRREAAARFSFLLSTPIILGAGLYKLKDLGDTALAAESPVVLVAGFLAAVISGFLSIKFLLGYLRKGRLYPFAIYCWVAGLTTLLVAVLAIR
jgi:undecaprenyl-diphosphatase